MIEKPKRPKKIPNQDNKQPQTIQELIRRYDLDNTKIYDYLDSLVEQINSKETQNDKQINQIETKVIGTILYENEAGTAETITLSDTAINFDCIEIFYKDQDNRHNNVKVCSPNEKTVALDVTVVGSSQVYIGAAALVINETEITFLYNRRAYAWAGIDETLNPIKITKIVGYR